MAPVVSLSNKLDGSKNWFARDFAIKLRMNWGPYALEEPPPYKSVVRTFIVLCYLLVTKMLIPSCVGNFMKDIVPFSMKCFLYTSQSQWYYVYHVSIYTCMPAVLYFGISSLVWQVLKSYTWNPQLLRLPKNWN